MGSHLFVIDSSPAIRRLVEEAATAEGHGVAAFTDGPSALEQAERIRPDVIIADYHLEGLLLTTFCDKLNGLDLFPGTRLVLLTNSSDRVDEASLRSRGVHGFLHKPLQLEQVRELLQALRQQKAKAAAGNTQRRRSWPPESQAIGAEGAAPPAPLEELEEPAIPMREPVRKIAEPLQSTEVEMRTTAAAAAAAVAARRHKDAPLTVEAVRTKVAPPQVEPRTQSAPSPNEAVAADAHRKDEEPVKAQSASLKSGASKPKQSPSQVEPVVEPTPSIAKTVATTIERQEKERRQATVAPVTSEVARVKESSSQPQPRPESATLPAEPVATTIDTQDKEREQATAASLTSTSETAQPKEASSQPQPRPASATVPAEPVATTPPIKERDPAAVMVSSPVPPTAAPSPPIRPPVPIAQPKPAAAQPEPTPVQAQRLETPPLVPAPQQAGPPATAPAQRAEAKDLPAPLEQVVGDAFSTLIRTLSEQSYAQTSQLLTETVGGQVGAQLNHMVQKEVSTQLAAALSQEDVAKAVREAVQQALPSLITHQLSVIEQALRQDLVEKVAHVAEDTATKLASQAAEAAVEKHLPESVRQQLGPIEGMVKEAAQETAAHHVRQAAERIVREVAGEQIGQIVPTAVPDIAEAQIKKEIDRLTAQG